MKQAGIALTAAALVLVVHGWACATPNVDEEPRGIYVPDIGDAWTADTLKDASAEDYVEKIVRPQGADTAKRREGRTELPGKGAAHPNHARNKADRRQPGTLSSIISVGPWLVGVFAGSGLAALLVGLLALRWRRRARREQALQAGQDYQRLAGSSPRSALASGLVQHCMNGKQTTGSEQKPALDRRAA